MSNTQIKGLAKANNLWKKGLLVDDELKSKTSQENLLNNLHIPAEYILFAADYEAALEILQEHPDIKACIVDVRIPKNSLDFYDYKDDSHPDWGISLLPKINQLNKMAEIEIYSAQVPRDYIKERIDKFNNIKGFYGKDETKNKRDEIIMRLLRQTSFNYDDLNDDDATFIQAQTLKIKNSYKTLLEKILDIGEALIQVKKRLKYGQFGLWLASEFDMDAKTAQRYMNVASRFELNRQDNNLMSELSLNFVPTALFALAESSVPKSAREEAIKKAQEGEKISVKTAFEIKAKHVAQEKTRLPKTKDLQSSATKVQIEPDTQQPLPKQKIVKLIPQQNVWQLGKHFLFRGDPNSAEFLQQLPDKIVLNVAFPDDRSWLFDYPHQIDSSVSFSSIYQQDLEPMFFQTTIEEIIKSTTDANNVATICFCPNPIILSVAHSLGLRCFIAEPDRLKCEAIVKLWGKL